MKKVIISCLGFYVIASVGLHAGGGWPVVFVLITTAGFTTVLNKMEANDER